MDNALAITSASPAGPVNTQAFSPSAANTASDSPELAGLSTSELEAIDKIIQELLMKILGNPQHGNPTPGANEMTDDGGRCHCGDGSHGGDTPAAVAPTPVAMPDASPTATTSAMDDQAENQSQASEDAAAQERSSEQARLVRLLKQEDTKIQALIAQRKNAGA